MSEQVHAAPNGHRVLLEKDRVRVLEVRIKPGDTSGWHSHPACVVYQLNDARVKFNLPGGKSREVESKSGDIVWSEGGPTDDVGVIVELKR